MPAGSGSPRRRRPSAHPERGPGETARSAWVCSGWGRMPELVSNLCATVQAEFKRRAGEGLGGEQASRRAGEQASRRAGTAHRSRLVFRSRSPARLLARPPHGVYNSAGFGTSCASSPPTATRNGFPFQVIATMSEWGYVGLAFRVHTLVAGSYEKASHTSP